MKSFKVTHYELKGDKLIAEITDGKCECAYSIDRAAFEHWLTDGTGKVDMSYSYDNNGVITEVPVMMPMDQYWQQSLEINNGCALEHIHFFLRKDELSANLVRVELLEQRLKDIFTGMETAQRAEAYASLLEYGMMKKEVGEKTAAVLFKKIITSNAA